MESIGPREVPEALLLGRYDQHGRQRVVGRTGPLTLPARRELGSLLSTPRGSHPWPDVLPANRLGHWSTDDLAYTPIELSVVVEVDADACFEHGPLAAPDKLPPHPCRVAPT